MTTQTLTTSDVAERLHMKPANVRLLAHSGAIEASFVGRRWLFTEAALAAYLRSRSNRETRAPRASTGRRRRARRRST